jgi:predicted ATPase
LEALDNFGRACGLFDAIAIRRLGEYETDPFQLQVKIAGPAFNLVDVGYGVSQVLPILVDALTREPRGPLLLQQPEVHLHPRAQAELASFLAAVSKHRATQFVVETHSDHFIDRVRMDIRDAKTSSAKDVSLLYFERAKGIVNIHRIEIDDDGNVVDPPRGYRAFFLHEELRLLKG